MFAGFVQYNSDYKQTVIALVIANFLVLLGAFFLDWRVENIMVLFWVENLIIGFYNVVKLLTASGNKGAFISRLPFTVFFIVHYGIFCFGHAMFLFRILKLDLNGTMGLTWRNIEQLFEVISNLDILYGVIALFLSHGFSLYRNYFGKKEYIKLKTEDAMFLPYRRIFMLHMVIMASSFLIMMFNFTIISLIVLVLIKTIVDVRQHLSEHNPSAQKFKFFG